MFEHITSDPDILGGKLCIKGTRISVEFILELVASGATREDILRAYPHLTLEGIDEAMWYAARSERDQGGSSEKLPTKDERITHILAEITRILAQEYQPEQIILFGSYADGSPHEDSDIDLLVIKETDESPEQRWLVVKRLLNAVHHTVAVSPLVYTPQEIEERLRINDWFLREVLDTGVRLYG